MSEADFHELVAAWIYESFADVDHEPTLSSGKRPDFVVNTPFGGYVVEVEDTAASLYTGIGQAIVYSAETGLTPLVVFPADEVTDDIIEVFDSFKAELVSV